ncbi:MAG: protein kinase, partial [Planctomycetes bacterium]|nr:protein kinase [Planctomycetota bacterium]
MATVVRKITIPSSLQDEQTARLQDALGALPEKQRHLADRAPAAAVASSVERRSDAVEISYELGDARSVTEVISGGPIETEQLLDWAGQLCAVFAAAYPQRESALLRHGGLCPDAVWVTSSQQLRVLDFGLAESFAAASQSLDESWLMQVAGNVAPEVWNTPSRYGQQSDIFAVGVLLYELATGKHPFGAIRDDPEDCKYQILVEVPVPPRTRHPSLAECVSDVIYKAVRSEPEKRFSTFREMGAALEACRQHLAADEQAEPQPAAAPPPEAAKSTPQETTAPAAEDSVPAAADDQAQRKRYLEDQAQLRVEREQTESRQRERRERARRTVTKIRRHAVALTVSILALVVVGVGLYVATQRFRGREALQTQFADLNAELGKQFAVSKSHAMALLLGIEQPSPRLVRVLDDLRKVAPDIAPAIKSAAFSNMLCSRGQAALVLGEAEVVLTFELEADDRSTFRFTVDELTWARSISILVDALANAQLDEGVRGLTEQLRALFAGAQSVTQAGAKLADLSSAVGSTPTLGYLAYQGEFKMIDVGRFDPVLGEAAVVSEVVLMDKAGREIANVNARLVFAYDCGAEGSACQLLSVTVEPAEESLAHRRWCIENTQERIRQAFTDRDAEALARLTNPSQLAEIGRTLDWAKLCETAELVFDELDLDAAVAGSFIRYVPGTLPGSTSSFDSPPMRFAFEAASHWGVRASASDSWPAAPPALRRQQLGLSLLNQMMQAWRERDAEGYIALFEGTTRDAQSAADMFTRIDQSGAQFQISVRENPDTEIVLYVEISSDAEEYSQKAFEFVLREEGLIWKARSEHAGVSGDPLWVIAGEAYRTLVARLADATSGEIDSIESDFTSGHTRVSGLRQDMSNDEREKIQRWIAALRSAEQLFEPASPEFLGGFPLRATLRKAAAKRATPAGGPMVFHLLTLPGSPANLVYVQEREVQVSDIETLWSRRRGDQPWRVWSEITGAPPRDQVVGLIVAEAAELARELGCEIPTL